MDLITLTHADQIEDYSEYLNIRYCHYLMSHPDTDQKELDIILKFITYCIEQNEIDLDVPRGPNKTSFRQRRENLNEH